MSDEKPYPGSPGYSHTNPIYDNLPRTKVPSFSNEEIKTPDIPSPGVFDTNVLLWGGFPTLVEKLRYRWLERKKLKAMDPVARAQYKAWQKHEKDMRKGKYV